MTHKTKLKIYEWISYVCIAAATVICFAVKSVGPAPTLILLVLAIFCRFGMERVRRCACEEEIAELQSDVRRLTQLLAEEKKKNK